MTLPSVVPHLRRAGRKVVVAIGAAVCRGAVFQRASAEDEVAGGGGRVAEGAKNKVTKGDKLKPQK